MISLADDSPLRVDAEVVAGKPHRCHTCRGQGYVAGKANRICGSVGAPPTQDWTTACAGFFISHASERDACFALNCRIGQFADRGIQKNSVHSTERIYNS